MTETFADKLLNWETVEINDYIENWKNNNENKTLPEYLGLTEEEYNLWEKTPEEEKYEVLDVILDARKRNIPLADLLEQPNLEYRWLLYRGRPMDSGFGDAGEILWEENPVTINGNIIWFDNEETGETVAEILTHKSWSELKTTRYSGVFAIEYEVRKTPWPENPASTEAIVEAIEERDKETWIYGSDDLD